MTNSPERNGNAQAAPPNSASESELSRARSEALNVVQWLARVAQSYVPRNAFSERFASRPYQ